MPGIISVNPSQPATPSPIFVPGSREAMSKSESFYGTNGYSKFPSPFNQRTRATRKTREKETEVGKKKEEKEKGKRKKKLHHVDGLTLSGVKELLKAKEHHDEDFVTLTGYSGCIWGVAMKSTGGSLKPIFVSTGHRISLDTAIKIVKLTRKYRVPEPIRQADIRSRDYLRRNQI